MINISLVEDDDAVRACYDVMKQLRPHLSQQQFVDTVRLQRTEGYLLAALEEDGQVRALAGYRYQHMLAHGKFLYVDDLVTDETQRSRGHGDALFDWLVKEARAAGCRKLQLDSGVQRLEAHRFYFRKRMAIVSYHFNVELL